jgi:hypothetical protein
MMSSDEYRTLRRIATPYLGQTYILLGVTAFMFYVALKKSQWELLWVSMLGIGTGRSRSCLTTASAGVCEGDSVCGVQITRSTPGAYDNGIHIVRRFQCISDGLVHRRLDS